MPNPIYLGRLLALLGLALLLGTDWMLILILPAFLVLHFGVVLREERYLEQKSGAPYLAYKESAPLWLEVLSWRGGKLRSSWATSCAASFGRKPESSIHP